MNRVLKKFIKRITPRPIIEIYRYCRVVFRDLFVYTTYDSTEYWKRRAVNCQGQQRVLWENEEYNCLIRKVQKTIIERFIKEQESKELRVLDIGCGIGIVSRMIVDSGPNIFVDAVDFPEMIQSAANENPHVRIRYIESSAENYLDLAKQYNLILSSTCYSSIRDVQKMKIAVLNAVQMLDRDGTLLMIDPFHSWSYLARVKFSSKEMTNFMADHGFQIQFKSGMLFWPFRKFLANPKYSGKRLERRFKQGELLLSLFGKHFWADYKVLAFKKKTEITSPAL
jgi:2-polyprenyl-3-methyl-5-hydroxy-6-metoxy-1,4-benzoquinol methylase